MRRPRRIHLLLMAFTFVLFGTVFVAAECPVCFPGPDGGVRCSAGGSGGSGGGPPGGGGPTPTAVPTIIPTPTPTPSSPSDIFKSIVGPYSYNASQASCRGELNAIDPVSLIVRSADPTSPRNHLIHHGLGTEAGVGSQYFSDTESGVFVPVCRANEIGQASGLTSSRWHARAHTLTGARDPYSGTSAYITSLTPHYDKFVVDVIPFYGCSLFAHVVPEDFYNDGSYISGFRVARDRIFADWINSGQHSTVDIYNFDNVQPLRQCNGETPRSNGIVYHMQ